MQQWLRAATAAIAFGLLASCGGGSDAPPPPPAPPPPATGTIVGTVTAAGTGAPISGATIRVGGLTATSASGGSFILADVPPGTRSVVRFEASGYAPTFTTVNVSAGASAGASGVLTPAGATATVSAATSSTVTVANSPARVVLPANGLVNAATNAPVSGNVTVTVTPIDPARDPAAMPGDYTTASGQSIESFGAIHVDLRDGSGNRLNLGANQTATIRIPVSTRGTPPASVPLFFYNETTGRWVQEGTAVLAGTAPNQYYEGTVTHFTFWNADIVADTITVSGCVQNAQGARVANAFVESNGVDYVGRALAPTDGNGNFTVAMRRQSQALIDARTFVPALESVGVLAGPSNTNITLPQCLVLAAPAAAAPVIVAQPQSRTVAPGQLAVFSVTADGSRPITYQWRRNGQNIQGATQSTLLVPDVQPADNGAVFTVVVSNASGSVTSGGATLTVSSGAVAPTITTQPANQSVIAGQTATFSIVASGAPAPTYQWQRQGQAIAGATSASYTTPATTLADSGAQFTVVVSNSAGSVTSSPATLTVSAAAVAPTITQQPASITVMQGMLATFSVVATGTPAPTYQWRRNGADIPGATQSTYTIPVAAAGDNGAVFTVVVSNSAGSVTSSGATLTVTANQTGDIVRLAFLSFDMLELATSALLVTDDVGVFLASNAVCSGGGSVQGTLNGAALPVGQTAPLSATIAAAFTDCVAFPGSTYSGSNSVQYSFSSPDRNNGTATGTATNMRIVDRDGTTVTRDITGNGTVSGTATTAQSGNTVTETTNFTIGSGATLRSGISNLTATFTAGSQSVASTFAVSGAQLVPQQTSLTLNNSAYTVAGTSYVSSGTLNFTFNAQGLPTGGNGQITVSANGAQVGRIFFSNGVLSVEVNGQVTPFSRGAPVRAFGRAPATR